MTEKEWKINEDKNLSLSPYLVFRFIETANLANYLLCKYTFCYSTFDFFRFQQICYFIFALNECDEKAKRIKNSCVALCLFIRCCWLLWQRIGLIRESVAYDDNENACDQFNLFIVGLIFYSCLYFNLASSIHFECNFFFFFCFLPLFVNECDRHRKPPSHYTLIFQKTQSSRSQKNVQNLRIRSTRLEHDQKQIEEKKKLNKFNYRFLTITWIISRFNLVFDFFFFRVLFPVEHNRIKSELTVLNRQNKWWETTTTTKIKYKRRAKISSH